MKITKFVVLFNKLTSVLILVFGIGSTSILAADESVKMENVKKLVETFVEGEFQGILDMRQSYAIFDKPNQSASKLEISPYSLERVVISLVSDPLVAVENYVIGDALLKGNKVFVTVTFKVVAKTRSRGLPGREIYGISNKFEHVQYTLRRNNNEWKIDRPPIPRVSVEVLRKQYEGEIQAMNTVISSSHASTAQKRVYAALVNELKKINAISKSAT